MSEDRDYLLALEMQQKWNDSLSDNDIEDISEKKAPNKHQTNGKYRSNKDDDYLDRTNNLVHPQWETLDPTPDTQAMFRAFDDKFFQKRLRCVTLEWSKRMYSCAGICYSRRNRLGMDITIRLSEPLLKLRSRKDLVETMLHEMIHAYCFVLGIREGNGGHGPNFKKIMQGINKVAGTNITVYHTFHDEVKAYKTHWWRCNGVCQHHSPFFGYVKRTSNRAPGPNDIWWSQHVNSCGGTFMKIKEPEKPARKTKSKAIEANAVKKATGNDLRKFFPPTGGKGHPSGPVKSNGGGTLLLNPKSNKPIQKPDRPAAKVPDAKRKPGILGNVIGFKDLGNEDTPRNPKTISQPQDFSSAGKGYSLSNPNSTSTVDKGVDMNHLRDVWLKRFGNTTDTIPKPPEENNEDIAGNTKRRRLTTSDDDLTFVADETTAKAAWVAIDEDVMVHEICNSVIAISSSEEESDSGDSNESQSKPLKATVFADADERQKQIKKEILDDSRDLLDGTDDDIVLIDDDFDDATINTSIELADTSLVDDLFGEDTLLKNFKRENAVVPSCSKYCDDPRNDIVTCPICQEKLKRENFSEHLDGCGGITVKLELPRHNKAKSIKPKPSNPKKTSHRKGISSSTSSRERNILLSAGYTDEDIEALPDVSDTPISSPSDNDLNLSDRQRRTKNLYTPTRPCPACAREVDVDHINEHLDECLS